MDAYREKIIKLKARDDVKWDRSFVDLATLGIASNCIFTAYDPPGDPEGKALYDACWNEAKEGK